MTFPVLSDVQTFFASDPYISAVTTTRINYWLADIAAKNMISDADWGDLYFNGVMNLVGHYLYFYECNIVSVTGGIVTSETTAKVSRSYASQESGNAYEDELKLTKYGRMYLSLRSQLGVTNAGFVSWGGTFV